MRVNFSLILSHILRCCAWVSPVILSCLRHKTVWACAAPHSSALSVAARKHGTANQKMTEKKNEKFFVSIRTNRIDVSREDGSFHASILAVYADHRFTDSHHDDRIWKNICNQTPKKINHIYGYRTAMSMKSNETWVFAHPYFGKWWFTIGLFLLPAFCYLPVVCLEQPNPHNRYGWRCDLLDTTFSAYVFCFSDRKKAQTIV